MAGNVRFTDGGDTIDISPILGWTSPYARREAVNVTLSGNVKTHKWSQKLLESVPFTNVSSADRDQFYTWWNAKTDLTYTPDQDGAPGVTYTCKLMGDEFPLQLFNPASTTVYAGVLIVREV